MASFADKLAALRDRAGLSQYALAQRAGLTKQALSLLELGAREPSWETVQKLALALGVDYREFADPNLTLPERQPGRPRGRPKKRGRPPAATSAPPLAEQLGAVEEMRPDRTRRGRKPRAK